MDLKYLCVELHAIPGGQLTAPRHKWFPHYRAEDKAREFYGRWCSRRSNHIEGNTDAPPCRLEWYGAVKKIGGEQHH